MEDEVQALTEPSPIPSARFREEGLLWLINTSILHPRGLALSLQVGGEDDGKLELLDFEEYTVFDMTEAETADLTRRYLKAERKRGVALTGPVDHILDVDQGNWTIEHPLVCLRTYTSLHHCEMHQSVSQYPPKDLSDGRYRLTWSNDMYLAEPLEDEDDGDS